MARANFKVLSESNVVSYLHEFNYKLPFSLAAIAKIESVSKYSNNNFLFRIVLKGPRQKNYYLKQAQKYNKRSLLDGKPIEVHQGRMDGEVDLIRKLSKIWGARSVPHIFFYDRKNHAFLMNDVSGNARLLIDDFGSNYVHPELGGRLGVYLGRLHSTTFGSSLIEKSSPQWRRLILNFFDEHLGYGVRQLSKPSLVRQFYKEVAAARRCVVWGDPVYRNIFVGPAGRISCVDFDHTVKYDPMLDVGMLLAHWVWMSLKGSKKLRLDCHKFIDSFTKSYWGVWDRHHALGASEILSMKKRLCRWVGLYLVSRTNGKSGSYFRDKPLWECRIRSLGLDLFEYKITTASKRVINFISN